MIGRSSAAILPHRHKRPQTSACRRESGCVMSRLARRTVGETEDRRFSSGRARRLGGRFDLRARAARPPSAAAQRAPVGDDGGRPPRTARQRTQLSPLRRGRPPSIARITHDPSAAIAPSLLRQAWLRSSCSHAVGLAARSLDVLFQVRLGLSRLRAPVSRRDCAISQRTIMNNAG